MFAPDASQLGGPSKNSAAHRHAARAWQFLPNRSHAAFFAFLDVVAEKVANEAAGWQPALAALNLQAAGYDDMLDVTAKKLAPMLARVNDWGLCALSWSYEQLDNHEKSVAFRQRLQLDVARRGFSEADVKRSRFGPERW